MARDWGSSIRREIDDHNDRADQEAMSAWREFVAAFRRGKFDIELRHGNRR
jgi:hypothetical protein